MLISANTDAFFFFYVYFSGSDSFLDVWVDYTFYPLLCFLSRIYNHNQYFQTHYVDATNAGQVKDSDPYGAIEMFQMYTSV